MSALSTRWGHRSCPTAIGAVGSDSHAVIDEAKVAAVYVFGGGIDEAVAPALDGGFTVLELA